jgi:hypothetical protein
MTLTMNTTYIHLTFKLYIQRKYKMDIKRLDSLPISNNDVIGMNEISG